MEGLTDNDFRVLVQIDRKEMQKDIPILPNFPKVKEDSIKKSLDKLVAMGFIILDKDKWVVTYAGEQYMQLNQMAMEKFIDEYDASLISIK